MSEEDVKNMPEFEDDETVIVDIDGEEAVEQSLDKVMEKVVFFALDQAVQTQEQGGVIVPFTVLVKGDDLCVENHPGDTVEDCFKSAETTVFASALLIDAYVFCYDGFVDLADGEHDAIILEAAQKDGDAAEAYAFTYEEKDDKLVYGEALLGVGETESFFKADRPQGTPLFDEDDEDAEDADIEADEADDVSAIDDASDTDADKGRA